MTKDYNQTRPTDISDKQLKLYFLKIFFSPKPQYANGTELFILLLER